MLTTGLEQVREEPLHATVSSMFNHARAEWYVAKYDPAVPDEVKSELRLAYLRAARLLARQAGVDF